LEKNSSIKIFKNSKLIIGKKFNQFRVPKNTKIFFGDNYEAITNEEVIITTNTKNVKIKLNDDSVLEFGDSCCIIYDTKIYSIDHKNYFEKLLKSEINKLK
jgi:hypothetical protein